MLVHRSQKAKASETVSPVVLSLSGRAFVKGVGLLWVQLYQKIVRHLPKLLAVETDDL